MPPLIPDGVYLISCAGADLSIDLSGGGTRPATPLIGRGPHRGDNQKWEVRNVDGVNEVNEFRLRSVLGAVYVGIGFGRRQPLEAAVQPLPMPWSIEPAGPDLFRIRNPFADQSLSLAGDTEGSRLNLPPWEDGALQKWVFEPA
ncbi:RICIN domain-containing protein [Nocardiopsis baichengensis]|uniref:RICIN domain-containing protein n=1 Tax=Nocardiopsis baichengensis TaxID=280240 RepID=UPI0003452AFE|nr:RICIN domain-containing protein [Nocardiopsis baichengensis]